MSAFTIIVPGTEALQRICGTNDINLKLIESFLGVSVFARGNELSLDSDDAQTGERFNFIIERFLDEIQDGSADVTDEDLLRSILQSGGMKRFSSAEERALFDSCSISVPGGIRKVYPRSRGQAELVKMMRASDLVFAEGPAGCGKTFLAVSEALRLVLNHEKSTLILTRPVVEAGESLGYLPGALEEKINPYIRPLFDAMNAVLPRDAVRRLTESSVVEVAPLAYMRGRTLSDSVIILDEAQNTTREQMKMFLTRMGEGSKVFVTGDLTQIDLPKKTPSGLAHTLDLLKDVEGISVKKLAAQDVVRCGLVKRIIQAYENES